MTKLVTQPTPNSCGLACLAMYTGCDYDAMWDPVKTEIPKIVEVEQTLAGKNLDNAYAYIGLIEDKNMWRTYVEHENPMRVRQMLQGRPAMITCVSLNIERGQHLIYWDGFTLWDPSPKQTYQWLNQVYPIYLTLLLPYSWVTAGA